jgi:O-methyltransferase involved in polyketide biosynthesis
MGQNLEGVPETLLIPLWARAVESKQENPIIIDDLSIEMIEKIEYDFSKFDKAWMSQTGVVIRTELLDKATDGFICKNPDAVIINIGCGLDTRFFRVDNGRINWYDLDLPEVINVRKQFFEETDRYKMIDKSVFDYSWIKDVNTINKPVLIIAEGVLMYFTEEEVKKLMDTLVDSFKESEMLFEVITPMMAKGSKNHDTIKKMNAEFQWGIKNSKEMEKFSSKIKFVEEWNYFDYHKHRWRWMRLLTSIPPLKNSFNTRIIRLKVY